MEENAVKRGKNSFHVAFSLTTSKDSLILASPYQEGWQP